MAKMARKQRSSDQTGLVKSRQRDSGKGQQAVKGQQKDPGKLQQMGSVRGREKTGSKEAATQMIQEATRRGRVVASRGAKYLSFREIWGL